MNNEKKYNFKYGFLIFAFSLITFLMGCLVGNSIKKDYEYIDNNLQPKQVQPIVELKKANAIISNDFDSYYVENLEDRIKIILEYNLSENIYIETYILQWFDSTGIDVEFYLHIGNFVRTVYINNFDSVFALDYFNFLFYEFAIVQVDNLEFSFESVYINLNDIVEGESFINFDCPTEYYTELLQVVNSGYQRSLYTEFYLDYFLDFGVFFTTFFENIKSIATGFGGVLVSATSVITSLVWNSELGKLTIVGAGLALALGAGVVYLISRMVRGLIKQNERG